MKGNLFSVLSKEQIESLTKEERDTLTKLDEKLFPDYDKYVDEHMRQKSAVERVLEHRKVEEENDRAYRKEMEANFV